MTMIENDADQPPEREDEAETIPPEPKPETITAEPQESVQSQLRQAADLVPVTQSGADPQTLGQEITRAQYMAKASLSIPSHFHGNIGDCLAIIDIAKRSNLSPYMLAAKTYVDPSGKKLAFESQAYHAVLIGAGLLRDAALHVKYEGEGDARVCIVSGTLRGETEPRELRSMPLGTLRPKRNDKGYVKGSPLWDKKPDVQMFYDTSRDWSRMFAPNATLGMMAQYETIETPIDGDFTVVQPGNGLADRLTSATKTGEGFKPGQAERELAMVASDAKTTILPTETSDQPETTSDKAKPTTKSAKKTKADKKKSEPDEPARPAPKGSAAAVKAAADRAEATSQKRKDAEKGTEKPTPSQPEPKMPEKPANAAEYQIYALDWISKTSDPEAALARWEKERDTRDDLVVRTTMRNDLRARIERKHGV